MIVEYVIDTVRTETDPITVVTLSGKAEPAPIMAMLGELIALSSASPIRIMIDESKLDPALLGAEDIRRFSKKWSAATNLNQSRVAVLAPNPLMYGLNRMFQLMLDSSRIDVFRDREKALAWLRTD